MKTSRLLPLALFLASAGSLLAGDPTSLSDAITSGKVSLTARLRYESVEQTGLRDAHAFTLRTRLGFTTAAWQGWKAQIEAENIVAADGNTYSQAGLNPGGTGRAVIADPETTELNQILLSFTSGKTTATLGRQRLVLDNARFVGDVGWRQNMQTFDAVVLQDKSLDKTTLTYAYLDRIDRVFGDHHAQGYWKSSSHLFNATYAGLPAGTLTGYVYLLDFRKPAYAANSCATYGASFAGATKISGTFKFTYRAEIAAQTDYGSSPLGYRTNYYDLEAGLGAKQGSLSLGHEVLGSDHNVGFKTPLATLHAFNGWADLFLTTPATGLRDTYVKGSANLPRDLSLLAFYHWFTTDKTGAAQGNELDVQVAHKFGARVNALFKYANFRQHAAAFPNVQKVWAQVEFAY